MFGNNFKRYRKKVGISQKEFAEKFYNSFGKKITLSSISNYETGLHLPSPQTLPVIAEILQISIDALFEVEKETPASKKNQAVPQGELLKRKQELKTAELHFINLKYNNNESFQKEVKPVADYCNRVIKLAKMQQDELLALQNELSSIREVLSTMGTENEIT